MNIFKLKKKIIILILLSFFILFLLKYNKNTHIFLYKLFFEIKTLGGNLWKIEPEYSSYMKYGFNTNFLKEHYIKFHYAIQPRISSGNNKINIEQMKTICDEMLNYAIKNNLPRGKKNNLPIISIKDSNHKIKILEYIKKDFPFVIRDLDLDVFNNMKFNNIIKLFKDDKILFSPSQPYCKEQQKDYFSNIVKNKCYASNITSVFNKHKNLMTDSDVLKIKKLSNGDMMSKQLFCGVSKGSGTSLHCAYTHNFFINIEGMKTWTFFNPNNTPLLYPFFSDSGIYNGSYSKFINFKKNNLDYFPLIKYCDYFEYKIKPGEILYNPSSWWHAVYNETDITVAISTRWIYNDMFTKYTDYHLLRSENLRNKKLQNLFSKLYSNYGKACIAQVDEHNILGDDDKNNLDIPIWDKMTNDNHNLCVNEDCHLNWHNFK